MRPSGSARATTRYRPMAAMQSRMSRSSRLACGRTTAPTASARASAASAMDRAPGIDADPIRRQEHRDHALLGDAAAADRLDRKVGAQEYPVGDIADEVGAEERAEERERVHACRERVGLG